MTRSLSCLVFIGAACFAVSADAQFKENIAHYYEYVNAAVHAKYAGKKDSAIIYLRMAVNADSANSKPYRLLADLLIGQGKYTEGINYLRRDVLMGATPPEKFEYLFENYETIKDRPEVIQFQKDIPLLTRRYYSTYYDYAFASMTSKMYGYDQAIRGSIDKISNSDSSAWSRAMSIQNYLDTAINLPELLAYVKSNGFPAYRTMDDEISSRFHLIVHHLIAGNEGQGIEDLNKLIQNAIYEGKYPAQSYMLALDWGAINRTGKQMYGTYIGQGPTGETTFVPEIMDIAMVDTRRAKWKQHPLKDVSLFDWRAPKLPVDYKP